MGRVEIHTESAQRRFTVNKPWGDTRAYDVGIEHGQNFLRVQVKSTCYRIDAGYRCKIVPGTRSDRDYSLRQIDLFAAYVIPEEVWYLIPALLLLGERRKEAIMLCPVTPPHKEACYCYECYREKWSILTKNRTELRQYTNAAHGNVAILR